MKFWIFVLALALSACSLFARQTPPDVSLAGLRMGAVEGLQQTILLDLTVTNLDSAPLKLNALSYRVRLEGRELATGSNREPIEIPAGATSRYTVPANINLMSSFGFIKGLLMQPKNKINYEVEATLEPAGLFSMPITVRKSDSISLSQ
jgi:LEA14-like dessication related protein